MDDLWKEQAKRALVDIQGIGFDYDGCHNVKDLKRVIDCMVVMAQVALKGTYSYDDDAYEKALEEYQQYRKGQLNDSRRSWLRF